MGLVGVPIKHNLDRLIASSFLGYKNSFNYWAPLGKEARLDHLSDTETKFLATLLFVSIPFVWVGVAMTVKRLRDAGQPVWLVVLFFVPYINLLFFFFWILGLWTAKMCPLPLPPWPVNGECVSGGNAIVKSGVVVR